MGEFIASIGVSQAVGHNAFDLIELDGRDLRQDAWETRREALAALLRQVKPAPSEGWRRWLYRFSGQLINVGESPRVMRYNDLTVQVNAPLRGLAGRARRPYRHRRRRSSGSPFRRPSRRTRRALWR